MNKLFSLISLVILVTGCNAAVKTTTPEQIAVSFLMKHEGTVKVGSMHVLYDDGQPSYIRGRFNTAKIIRDGETFEQFKARCKGRPTIGYGETSEAAVKKLRITEEEAKAFLTKSVKSVSSYMPKKFGKAWNNLNTNQKAAVISYFYNCGMYSKHPAMLKLMKTNPSLCYKEMDAGLKTAKAKGQTGLTKRRAAEVALFKKK